MCTAAGMQTRAAGGGGGTSAGAATGRHTAVCEACAASLHSCPKAPAVTHLLVLLHIRRGHGRTNIRAGGEARRATAHTRHIAGGRFERIEVHLHPCSDRRAGRGAHKGDSGTGEAGRSVTGPRPTPGRAATLATYSSIYLQHRCHTWGQRLRPYALSAHCSASSSTDRGPDRVPSRDPRSSALLGTAVAALAPPLPCWRQQSSPTQQGAPNRVPALRSYYRSHLRFIAAPMA